MLPQIVEPESDESRFLGQRGPRSVPEELMLIRIVAALPFVRSERDSRQVLRHQIVLRLGRRSALRHFARIRKWAWQAQKTPGSPPKSTHSCRTTYNM
jgi:hypothetical protein